MIHLAVLFGYPSAILDSMLEEGIFVAAGIAGIPRTIHWCRIVDPKNTLLW